MRLAVVPGVLVLSLLTCGAVERHVPKKATLPTCTPQQRALLGKPGNLLVLAQRPEGGTWFATVRSKLFRPSHKLRSFDFPKHQHPLRTPELTPLPPWPPRRAPMVDLFLTETNGFTGVTSHGSAQVGEDLLWELQEALWAAAHCSTAADPWTEDSTLEVSATFILGFEHDNQQVCFLLPRGSSAPGGLALSELLWNLRQHPHVPTESSASHEERLLDMATRLRERCSRTRRL